MPKSDLSPRDQARSVAVNADTCLSLFTVVEASTATGRSFFLQYQLLALFIHDVFQVGGMFLHHFHDRIGNIHSIRQIDVTVATVTIATIPQVTSPMTTTLISRFIQL